MKYAYVRACVHARARVSVCLCVCNVCMYVYNICIYSRPIA